MRILSTPIISDSGIIAEKTPSGKRFPEKVSALFLISIEFTQFYGLWYYRGDAKSIIIKGISTEYSYIPRILSALRDADLSKYKDSMRPLIEKDIAQTDKILTEFTETTG